MRSGVWQSPLKSVRSAAVLSAVVALLISANSIWNDFAYDDRGIIVDNERIQSVETLPEAILEPYWPNEYGKDLGLWRPVTTGVFGIQWILFGDNAVPFHVLQLLLHAGVTALVVLLAAEIAPLSVALVAGLLFAVHPVHTEAVANVVGTAEVLSSVMYLLACLLILRRGLAMGVAGHIAVWALYLGAFLTKESAVTLLGVVVLLDSARTDISVREVGTYLRRRGVLYAGMILTAGAVLWARVQVLGSVSSPFGPIGTGPLEGDVPRIWTVASTWPHYFRLLFFPYDLSSDYSPGVIPIAYSLTASGVLGVVFVFSALAAAWVTWRRAPLSHAAVSSRAVGFGIVWFAITISPVSNILFLSGVLLAERTLYLPSVGFVIAAAWILVAFHRERPRLAHALLALSLVLMGVRTVTRNLTWKDNLTVFDTLLNEHPESGRGQWLQGDVRYIVGDRAGAFRSYSAALSLLNGDYPLLVEIGRHALGDGRDELARVLLERAWGDRPERGIAPQLLAVIYQRREEWEKAVEAASAAEAFYDGADATTSHMLAQSLAQLGRWEEAVAARQRTIEAGEGDRWQQWFWLAEAQAHTGDTVAARTSLQNARARTEEVGDLRQIDSLGAILDPR